MRAQVGLQMRRLCVNLFTTVEGAAVVASLLAGGGCCWGLWRRLLCCIGVVDGQRLGCRGGRRDDVCVVIVRVNCIWLQLASNFVADVVVVVVLLAVRGQ